MPALPYRPYEAGVWVLRPVVVFGLPPQITSPSLLQPPEEVKNRSSYSLSRCFSRSEIPCLSYSVKFKGWDAATTPHWSAAEGLQRGRRAGKRAEVTRRVGRAISANTAPQARRRKGLNQAPGESNALGQPSIGRIGPGAPKGGFVCSPSGFSGGVHLQFLSDVKGVSQKIPNCPSKSPPTLFQGETFQRRTPLLIS